VLGDSIKRAEIRNFCCLNNIDIMCLQETKLYDVTGPIMRSLAVSQDPTWAYLAADGSADGLLIGWNAQKWTWQSLVKGYHSLTVIFKDNVDSSMWALSNVYGPHSANERERERESLWQELRTFSYSFLDYGVWRVILILLGLFLKGKG